MAISKPSFGRAARAGLARAGAVMAAILVAAAGPARGEPVLHGDPKAAAEIAAAETAYAALFAKVGAARAMPAFLDAKDGLAFRGADPPVHAVEAGAAFAGDDPDAVLSWTPAEIFASTAGDMGASWGRFVLTDTKGVKAPVRGRYVTVWRKDPSGAWKALMDMGETEPSK